MTPSEALAIVVTISTLCFGAMFGLYWNHIRQCNKKDVELATRHENHSTRLAACEREIGQDGKSGLRGRWHETDSTLTQHGMRLEMLDHFEQRHGRQT